MQGGACKRGDVMPVACRAERVWLIIVMQAEVRGLEARLEQARAQVAEAEQGMRLIRHEASKAAHLLRERDAELLRADARRQPEYTEVVRPRAAAVSVPAEAGAARPTGSSGNGGAQQVPLEEEAWDAHFPRDALLAQLHQARQDHQQRLQEAEQQVHCAQQLAAAEADQRAALEADVALKDVAMADMRDRLRELEAHHVTSSGKSALQRWDYLIEEAAGQLSGVEEQLRTASEQLLALQGCQAHEEATSAAAARHRSAAQQAAKDCAAACEDRRRTRADVSAAEDELQRLNGELSAGRDALHDQQQALGRLQQERARATEQALEACSAGEAARAELQAMQEQAVAQEARMERARKEFEAVRKERSQVAALRWCLGRTSPTSCNSPCPCGTCRPA